MITKELKKLHGSVLGIGIDSKKLLLLENNNNIEECYLLDSDCFGASNIKGYAKTINIHKIKKYFRKKSFDYIVCNFEQIKPYLRKFIKNSIYLNRNKLYFYNINDFELKELEYRYTRYNADFKKEKDFVIIDNSKAKTNLFKNSYFYIRDLIYDVIDYIGKILVN